MYCTLTLALALAAPAPKGDSEAKPSLVGEWEASSLTWGGQDVPLPEGGITFDFAADGTAAVREGRAAPSPRAYKLDPSADPPAIDIGRPGADEPVSPGIYRLDGNALTLCLGVGPKAGRPKRFESPAGSRAMLMTLKRAKKKD